MNKGRICCDLIKNGNFDIRKNPTETNLLFENKKR